MTHVCTTLGEGNIYMGGLVVRSEDKGDLKDPSDHDRCKTPAGERHQYGYGLG